MDTDYTPLFGSLAHISFALIFFSLINKRNTRRIILIFGHIFVSLCFILRFLNLGDMEILFPYVGITGHSIILLFFIATTIIDKMSYRIVSSNILINLLCILGQIGMILHYVTIKLGKEDNNIFININTITTFLLFIFYAKIAIKQKKQDKILMIPLLMISLLYLIYMSRNLKSDIKRLKD